MDDSDARPGTVRTEDRASTPAARMVDVKRREVQLAVHVDPEIYEAELRDIFSKTWNFIAHESELKQPGDYVTRYIGKDPVLVTKGDDGKISCVLNSCSHKGALICRSDRGKARKFVCPYHGFTFAGDGSFVSTPFEPEIYGRLDRSELQLPSARVETVAGLVFANWDKNAPSLKEDLGPYTEILEAAFDRDRGGLEVIGPPQRWMIDANWKMASEQFAGDGYHGQTCHSSVISPELKEASMKGVDMSYNGHGARCIDHALEEAGGARKGSDEATEANAKQLRAHPPAGMTKDMVEGFLSWATPAQVEMMAHFPPTVGCVFPNFGWLCVEMIDPESGAIVMVRDIRVLLPTAPDKCELWSWVGVDRKESEQTKLGALRARTLLFSPIGQIERDDMDSWLRIQEALKGPAARQNVARYRAITPPDDKSLVPGITTWRGMSWENGPWRWFLRWREFMNRELW